MKNELNLALYKSYISKCNNIKIDDYMFDSIDTQIKSISDIKNYGCRLTIDRYIKYHSEIIKTILQKHDIDLNEIEKISIYIISDLDVDNHMYYILNACNRLEIKYIDLYKIEPNDPRGYYRYLINVDSFKSRINLRLELIKGCSTNTNIDAVLYDENININKINDTDRIFEILLKQFDFYFDTICILAKDQYIQPIIHLYIPEAIYDHLEEYLLIMRILLIKKSRFETLFIHCKDKVEEVNLW